MKKSGRNNQKIIADIGEFNLIKRILSRSEKQFVKNPDLKIEVPSGDDAFVARFHKETSLVFTTDTLMEGTHFDFKLMKNYYNMKNQCKIIGRKAMAVNLSDLAAMGDVNPLFALVTLGLNGDISVDFVDNFFDGMSHFLKKCGYFLAGGDIIRSDKSMISITIVGKANLMPTIQRSGAKKGDILMVSGHIGLSSAGLEVMKKRIKSVFGKKLIHSHLFPGPQLKIGKILASNQIKASSMIDTSDDLVTSVEILSEASGVGFEVNLERIPIHPCLRKISEKLHISPYEFMLYGGEDYQLLFTVEPSKAAAVKRKIPSAIVLGEVKSKSFGNQFRMNGRPFKMKDRRFKHF